MATLETPWVSSSEADEAVANYFGEGGGGGGGDGDGDGNGGGDNGDGGVDVIGDSPTLSGSLAVSSTLVKGGAFTAEATVRNSGSTPEEGQLVLVSATDATGVDQLDTVNTTIEAGERVVLEYNVPQGALQTPTGDVVLAVIAYTSTGTGIVTKQTVSVTDEYRENDDVLGEWGEPYFLRELPYSWNLYAQDHNTKDTYRYLISAKNSAGETIYLSKSGTVVSSPVYFYDVDSIVSALDAYGQRYENGEVGEGDAPDPTQPRPTPQELINDMGKGGILGSLGLGNVPPIGYAIGIVLVAFLLNRYGKISDKSFKYIGAIAAIGMAAATIGGD